MVFDKPIIIQKRDEITGKWEDYRILHARVNNSGGSEFLGGGSTQSQSSKVFEVRYHKDIEVIDDSRDLYRIVYRDRNFNITGYDDFQESHKTVKLLGVSYG